MAGTLLYSYRGTGVVVAPDGKRVGESYNEATYDALAEVFPGKAPFPTLPWKAQPTQGHVKGNVFSGSGLAWADGAEVTLSSKGVKRAQTVSGTGFYAFVDLPPGNYAVTATHQGETSAPRIVAVRAGAVASADFLMAGGDLPPIRPIHGIGAEPEGARAMLQAVTITVGTDALNDQFFAADRVGGTPLLVYAPKSLLMPLVAGDLVTITGLVRKEAGRTVLAADAVQVVGSRPL